MTFLIQNLGWTDLETRRKISRILRMFKNLNELVGTPITDRLILADKRTRGGHNHVYKHLRANTTLGQKTFWRRTIPDCNHPPGSCHRIKKNCGSVKESTTSLFPPSSMILLIRGAADVYTVLPRCIAPGYNATPALCQVK